jgi:ABC-type nitrate/sulfonate/bicarbonate transport system permease component
MKLGFRVSGQPNHISAVVYSASPLVIGIIEMVTLAIILTVASWGHPVSPYYPTPSNIILALLDIISDPTFLRDTANSIFRLLAGYAMASTFGIGLGWLMSQIPIFRQAIRPIIEFLRPLPIPAILPIFIAFAGMGNLMKILTILFACIWPIILSSVDAIANIDQTLLDMTDSFRIRGLARWTKILFPASLPELIVGLRISLPIALIGVLLSEMVGEADGLGAHLIYFQRTFQVHKAYALLFIIACIGYCLNLVFVKLQRYILSKYGIGQYVT